MCLLLLTTIGLVAQKKDKNFTLDYTPFYGTILEHSPGIAHLIQEHPSGFMLSYNVKTYGDKKWEALYNYPDYGVSFLFQDMKTETLGKHYGLFAHYNFYFLNRNLSLGIGTGISYNTNPYDKEENFRNVAYASHLLSATYLKLNYRKENIIKGFGLHAGVSLIHYSVGSIKSPNTSTNILAFNLGVNYMWKSSERDYNIIERKKYSEPIAYNIVFKTGIVESDVINSGQYPFYILTAYADKRVSNKSSFHLGTEIFFSNFLKEHIKHRAIAYPNGGVTGNEDYKRVGVFGGYELHINRTSIFAQLGYYAYYPYDFEGKVYTRLGLKRTFGKQMFGSMAVKSHAAKAEAIEIGIGIRL